MPGVTTPSPPEARSSAFAFSDALDLAVISCGLLFLEQACIRWLPAHIRLLGYFSNFVLLAAFLGMGLGLLRTGRRSALPFTVPLIAAISLFLSLYRVNVTLAPDASGQSIYFGAELLVQSGWNVPFGLVLAVGLVVLAGVFCGPGQAMGERFDRLPPLRAYAWNIGGSIAGVLAFMGASALSLSPAWWFGFGGLCVAWLLRGQRAALAVTLASLGLAVGLVANLESGATWSPYNCITQMDAGDGGTVILVNKMSHQVMLSASQTGGRGMLYELPYAVGALSGRPLKLDRCLVIGAGSGNDVSRMLRHGAQRIDAVEIDASIRDMGRAQHPDRPYADPRVNSVIDDGRAYLRRSGEQYDLVLYALVDSLTLLSQYGAVRLENYLFTQQAFEQVRDHLAPDGIFIAYNFYREAWLAARIYRLLERVFGPDRCVMLTFPPRDKLDENDHETDLVIFMAGDVGRIRQALLKGDLALQPLDGKSPPVPLRAVSEVKTYDLALTTDDWPFPYLRGRALPTQNLQAIAVIGVVSVLVLFGPGRVRPRALSPHFFFLGAAFMLVETEGIARLALLFGTTWVNSALTFLGILTMALLSNIVAARAKATHTRAAYGGLALALAIAYLVPLGALLGLPAVARSAVALLLLFAPVFFAGLVFAFSFRESASPHQDLGSNILGSLAGGCLENLSTVTGYHALILVVGLLYLLSAMWAPRRSSGG